MRMTVIVLDSFSSDGNAPNLIVGQKRSHVENYLSLSLLQSTTIKTFRAQQRGLHPTVWHWRILNMKDGWPGTHNRWNQGNGGDGAWDPRLLTMEAEPTAPEEPAAAVRAAHMTLASCMGTQTLLPKKSDSNVHEDQAHTLTLPAAEAYTTPAPAPSPTVVGPLNLITKVKVGMGCSIQLNSGPSSSPHLPHNGTCFKGSWM